MLTEYYVADRFDVGIPTWIQLVMSERRLQWWPYSDARKFLVDLKLTLIRCGGQLQRGHSCIEEDCPGNIQIPEGDITDIPLLSLAEQEHARVIRLMICIYYEAEINPNIRATGQFFSLIDFLLTFQLANVIWWYYFSKVIEFLDTVSMGIINISNK